MCQVAPRNEAHPHMCLPGNLANDSRPHNISSVKTSTLCLDLVQTPDRPILVPINTSDWETRKQTGSILSDSGSHLSSSLGNKETNTGMLRGIWMWQVWHTHWITHVLFQCSALIQCSVIYSITSETKYRLDINHNYQQNMKTTVFVCVVAEMSGEDEMGPSCTLA